MDVLEQLSFGDGLQIVAQTWAQAREKQAAAPSLSAAAPYLALGGLAGTAAGLVRAGQQPRKRRRYLSNLLSGVGAGAALGGAGYLASTALQSPARAKAAPTPSTAPTTSAAPAATPQERAVALGNQLAASSDPALQNVGGQLLDTNTAANAAEESARLVTDAPWQSAPLILEEAKNRWQSPFIGAGVGAGVGAVGTATTKGIVNMRRNLAANRSAALKASYGRSDAPLSAVRSLAERDSPQGMVIKNDRAYMPRMHTRALTAGNRLLGSLLGVKPEVLRDEALWRTLASKPRITDRLFYRPESLQTLPPDSSAYRFLQGVSAPGDTQLVQNKQYRDTQRQLQQQESAANRQVWRNSWRHVGRVLPRAAGRDAVLAPLEAAQHAATQATRARQAQRFVRASPQPAAIGKMTAFPSPLAPKPAPTRGQGRGAQAADAKTKKFTVGKGGKWGAGLGTILALAREAYDMQNSYGSGELTDAQKTMQDAYLRDMRARRAELQALLDSQTPAP